MSQPDAPKNKGIGYHQGYDDGYMDGYDAAKIDLAEKKASIPKMCWNCKKIRICFPFETFEDCCDSYKERQ